MTKLEVSGYWWVPSRPERKIPGTLTFDADRGATLSLIGAVTNRLEEGIVSQKNGVTGISFTEDSMDEAGKYPRVVGEAEGKLYTLEGCFERNRRSFGFSLSAPEIQILYANLIVAGARFEDNEPLTASSILFSLDFLPSWIRSGGIKEKVLWQGEGDDRKYLRTELSSDFSLKFEPIRTDNGYTLQIEQLLGSEGDRVSSRALTQSFRVRVAKEDLVPVLDLIEVASDFQDLVSIGLNRTAALQDTDLLRPDLAREAPGGKSRLIPVRLYARWAASPDVERRPPELPHTLFIMDDVGRDGIKRWLDVARTYRTQLGRAMATRYAPEMFTSDRYSNRLAAIEAYDRTKTGHQNSTLRTRLKRCTDQAGPDFASLVGDVGVWIDYAYRERLDLAHHYDWRLHETSEDQYYLAESAYWLFILCLLREADAPEAVFRRAVTTPGYRWVQRKLPAVLSRNSESATD